jgi:hypothetical protein
MLRRAAGEEKAQQGGHLGCPRCIEWVVFFRCPGMFRRHIDSIHDLQPCRVERSEHLRSRPQSQVLSEVRRISEPSPFGSR